MNEYDDIKLTKQVEIAALNEVLSKLLMNDKMLVPVDSIKPSIWVARWINGEDAYNRGDAVWVNTEDIDSFVNSKTEYIKIYLRQDKRYYGRINQAEQNGDVQAMFEILKEGVAANDIFYVGDITQPAQIKICKRDGTKQPPSNSAYWEDFWVTSTADKCRDYILDNTYRYLTSRFNKHVYNYHLSGWTESSFSDWLDKGLESIPYDDQYHYYSHRSKSFYDGFDYVRKSETRLFGNGIVKWFRWWNSGFLEQGGVIDIDKIADSQDSTDGNMVTVNLGWSGERHSPPSYNFVKIDGNSVYGSDSKFKAYGSETDISEVGLLDRKSAYSVTVTPISDGRQAYQTFNGGEGFYDICPVLNVKNSSFQFIVDNTIKKYSFYTSGFTTHTT